MFRQDNLVFDIINQEEQTVWVTGDGILTPEVVKIPNYIVYNGEKYTVCKVKKSYSETNGYLRKDKRFKRGYERITWTDSAEGFGRNLRELIIPDSVTTIEEGAFENCTSLKSITIPNGIVSIKNGAFMNCKALTSVTIGSGVKYIKQQAFYACTSLKSITIPKNVLKIEDDAFGGVWDAFEIYVMNKSTKIGKMERGADEAEISYPLVEAAIKRKKKQFNIITWGIAIVAIIVQGIVLHGWAVLSGIGTLLLVGVAYFVKNRIENSSRRLKKVQIALWIIAAIAILVQIVFWDWWAILSAIITIIIVGIISLMIV